MRTFDDLEFFYFFIEAIESRDKTFRIEGVPITFVIGKNNTRAFCVCAHYDESLIPYTLDRTTRTNIKVIETENGDYVADYLDKVNNTIRRAMLLPEVKERRYVFYGDDPEDKGKPYFWAVLRQNILDYVGWASGVKPFSVAA